MGSPAACGAGSMTITELTMSTTHLHTTTTTIGLPQPYEQSTVGRALPGQGVATGQWREMAMEQGSCGISAAYDSHQFQQPLIQFRM